MSSKKIVVVGAGPAGMMAAIRSSELCGHVTLIEQNPSAGRKLLLSGKGRCNLTNACGLDEFLPRFSGTGEFLRDAFKKFFNQELMRFFETRGLALAVERQLRVFPAAGRSDSVLRVLVKELEKRKVEAVYGSRLKDILLQSGRAKALMLDDGKVIPCDALILATGGASYSFTGSNGGGIRLAERLGHRVVALRPGLVPLEAKQPYVRSLEGLTLKNMRLEFKAGGSKITSEIGELLFTATGISGPLVLTLSGRIADSLAGGKRVEASIDLKPALSREQLNARLLREFKESSKKTLKNTLKSLLPQRMIGVFITAGNLNPDKIVSYMTQAERATLVSLLKGFRLDITRTLPLEEAMVTRGGVSLKDINPRTMESRRIKGLYFAGEMIDVDADTGGFNLQAAFSTGYLAGDSAPLEE